MPKIGVVRDEALGIKVNGVGSVGFMYGEGRNRDGC